MAAGADARRMSRQFARRPIAVPACGRIGAAVVLCPPRPLQMLFLVSETEREQIQKLVAIVSYGLRIGAAKPGARDDAEVVSKSLTRAIERCTAPRGGERWWFRRRESVVDSTEHVML